MTDTTTLFHASDYLDLCDPACLAEFLNASAEMNDPAVLLSAIATVARARGMTELARKAGLGRESLYKALAAGAHPRYDTVLKLVKAMGLDIRFVAAPVPASPKPKGKRSKGAPAEAPPPQPA